MKNSFLRRILVFITVSSIIAQSFSPYVAILSQRAYAQEVTDQTTTSETQTPVVEESTPAPESTTPTTSQEQVVVTETVTPTPAETTTEVTPTPAETTTEVTPTEVNNNSPPSENQGIDSSITPTETPVTITPEQEGLTSTQSENPKEEQLNLIVLDNVSAPSIDLEAVESEGSAVLTTDKPDYAPTDTALITGSNLLPNTNYTLHIWSDNLPATSTTVDIVSGDLGAFAYAYQLDGVYRPNYYAELKDNAGNVIASTTFTDSAVQTVVSACMQDNPSSPSGLVCTANDVSIASVNNIQILDDGCTSPGDTVTFTATWDLQSTSTERYDIGLYFATQGQSSALSGTCSVSTLANSPTPPWSNLDGDACGDITSSSQVHPIITMTATCNPDPTTGLLKMPYCTSWDNNAGGVCSTPADAFPSTKSKCNCQDGFTVPIPVPPAIEVVKNLVPSNDSGLFNLQVNGQTASTSANVGNTGTTGKVGVAVGNNTVGETAGTNTSLNDYSSTVSCVLRGTQTPVSTTGTNPWSLNVTNGQDIVCTITNTRQTATITVNKSLSPSNDPGLFNLQIDGQTAGTGANVGNAGTTGAVTVNISGQHTVSETAGTNTSISDYTTTWVCNNNTAGSGVSAGPFSLTANQNLICTFTNTRNTGSVLVNKLVDTNGDGTYEGGNTEATNLGFTWNLDGSGINNFGSTVSSINTGSHDVNENLNSQPYHFVGWYFTNDTSKTCANTPNTTLPASISVTNGQTANITICNARNTGTVMVHKDVQGPNGEDLTDTSNNFTVQLDATGSQQFTDNGSVTYNNVPTGSHTVTESLIPSGYTLYGISETQGATGNTGGLQVSVVNNQTTHVYVTNRQNPATITVVKIVKDADGQTVSDHNAFTVQLNGGYDDNSLADNHNVVYNVNPGGPYTINELDDADYDELGCKLVSGANATNFNVIPGEQVTVTCTNQQKPGLISGYKFQSDGITPIASWGISLFTCNSNFLSCVLSATTSTNGSGFYSFTNLLTGFYKVVEDLVAGFTPVSVTSHNVTINPNTQSENNNFANFKNINITVCKEDTNQNRIAGWEMTLNVDNVASGGAQLTDRNGCYVFTDLGPGHSYSVTEENRNGWTPVSDTDFTYDFGVPQDGIDQNHTFVNVELGTITVKKVMVGDTGSFDFTEDVSGNISVNNGTLSTNDILPGTYTSVEGAETGWNLDSIVCNDTTNGGTASTGDTGTRTATFNVDAGESVTCTFTNSKLPKLTVNKILSPSNDPGLFNLFIDSTEYATNVGNSGSTGSQIVTIGTHSVSETAGTQTTLSDYTTVYGGDCDSQGNITLAAGEDKTCTITNTRNTGSIKVNKLLDNGDNTTTVNPNIFTWTLDSGTENEMGATVSNVNTGSHSINENTVTNYHLVGWYPGGIDSEIYSCSNLPDNQNNTVLPASVNVEANQTTEITICNARDTGTITVVKDVVSVNEDDGLFNLIVNEDEEATNVGDNGSTGPVTVVTGTHSVGETAGTETTLNNYITSISCVDGGGYGEEVASTDGNGTTLSGIQVNKDDDIVCTVTNTRKGNVIVVKYNDEDGDGELVGENPVLSDWTINLDELSLITGGNGTVEFNNLTPGLYTLSEDLKPGWEQTNMFCDQRVELDVQQTENQEVVSVSPGETVFCSILNHNLTPILTISKENDAVGNKSGGDIVTYTITLTLDEEGGPAENLEVTDLLPKGFTYNSGSWQVLLNGNPIVTGEPTYASPGTWSLGSADPGDVFTLIYRATIDGSQQTGTYYDNAWGQGTAVGSSDVILASAVNPGQLDDTFVGTEVAIVNGNVAGVDYKAASTQEVLGASTYLPATGENTLWVIIATLLSILGFGSITLGFRLRKKYE